MYFNIFNFYSLFFHVGYQPYLIWSLY